MDKPLTLTLHSRKKGVADRTLSVDFVPLQKAIDASNVRGKYADLTEFSSVDYMKDEVAFVAKLFGITPKEIFDGVDAREWGDVDGVIDAILGINPN